MLKSTFSVVSFTHKVAFFLAAVRLTYFLFIGGGKPTMFLVRSSCRVGLGQCLFRPSLCISSASESVSRSIRNRLPASNRFNVTARGCSTSTARLPEIQKIRPDLKTHEELYRFSIEQVIMITLA